MEENTWIGLVIAAVVVGFILFQKPNSPVEELKAQTMAIHDEAMVEMAEMNRIGRALKRELAQLPEEAPRADSIRTVLRQMKKAESDMYDWMRQYQDPIDRPQEEALRYLEEKKRLISQNQQDIRAARDAGRQLFDAQPNR